MHIYILTYLHTYILDEEVADKEEKRKNGTIYIAWQYSVGHWVYKNMADSKGLVIKFSFFLNFFNWCLRILKGNSYSFYCTGE